MTYELTDTSTQSGRPVELYRFAHGANTYLFNSGSVDVAYLGDIYAAAPIERGPVEVSPDFGKAYITVTAPYDSPIARLFTAGHPDGQVTLALFRSHLADGEWVTYWRGRVIGVDFTRHQCELRCEPIFTTMVRAGLRSVYQLQCRHVLYGEQCGVVKASYSLSTTLSFLVANQMIVYAAAAYPDNWFAGGSFETAHGSRMIVSQVGEVLQLSAGIPDLTVGETVTLAVGCDHQHPTCVSKFSNAINFGGFPWIPQKNPFDGDAIA